MSFTAVLATSLVAGPATAHALADACALTRSAVHHSEGLSSWNGTYPRPHGELRAVMAFLSFPDAEPLDTPDELVADHFPDTTEYFTRASYGKFRLRVDPVKRWLEMPADSTTYGIGRDWDTALRAAYLSDAVGLVDRVVDFSRYDIVYLVADPNAPGVDSDATKVVNFDQPMRVDGTDLHRIVTVFEQRPPDRSVLAHETGHVFDLPDLYHRPRSGTGDWDTHVGDWDLMGSQFGLAPELFGWHKWKLGWLDRGEIDCVREPGRSAHLLVPVSAPAGRNAPAGPRLIVVRTGLTRALAVEARAATGNDAATCTEGVLVYRVHSETPSAEGPVEVLDGHPRSGACWEASVYPELADAPLGVGERLRDPESGVSVEVLGTDTSGRWTVRVEVEPEPSRVL
ncbi:M6 family metalloprotease domain-containing protein [Streptomyces zingiberis]|uniref:M6 family metalloprotease domain-containing protein n=1 Tax=Streptomyces zingiberis TaxID=2053010 RepID=A0ABX1C2Y6_9ACTN|nr:M6 family metalloprotease domain-containing protein [Streptomyces zingiberis]NJQ02485.1 M6 family metalloprotease domain-containing protein [Streptomyces zingiberis]